MQAILPCTLQKIVSLTLLIAKSNTQQLCRECFEVQCVDDGPEFKVPPLCLLSKLKSLGTACLFSDSCMARGLLTVCLARTVCVDGQGRCNSDHNARSVTIMITDACPGCEADHLDIQALTFNKAGLFY